MTYFHLKNHWFVWPIFLLLLTYAILRAVFVELLFDELGTFYWYIQTGLLPGKGATLDANNHILNSFIGNQLYTAFGDHFILYRLLPLISFPVYFFSARHLLLLSDNRFSIFTFLALISVHWIFDYFTLSRGYGPSLAFFLLLLCFILHWTKSFRTVNALGVILCFILILLCNLSMLIPVLLLFGYLLLCFILFFRSFQLKERIFFIIISLSFILFLVPVLIYLNKLKKAGALWWGSTDGLWEVTGKSLAQNTLFTEHILWKFIFTIILLSVFILFILTWKKNGTKTFLLQQQFYIPVLLWLCVLSAVLLATFLQVNYPMDRVGMYLVPLFILTIGILFQEHQHFKWSLICLLWFPVSFIAKLNLNTTIFSPEDRIHEEFYDHMKTLVGPNDVLSADYVSQASFAYLSRSEKHVHMLVELSDDTQAQGKFHLSWQGNFNHPGYRLVLRDPVSKTSLYEHIHQRQERKILDTLIPVLQSKEVRIPLLELPLSKKMQDRGLIRTTVSGSTHLQQGVLGLNLSHELLGENNESLFFQPTRFDRYFGHKTHYSFSFPNQPFRIDSTHHKLLVFMMNNNFVDVTLKNVRVQVYLSGQ